MYDIIINGENQREHRLQNGENQREHRQQNGENQHHGAANAAPCTSIVASIGLITMPLIPKCRFTAYRISNRAQSGQETCMSFHATFFVAEMTIRLFVNARRRAPPCRHRRNLVQYTRYAKLHNAK